MGLNLSLNANTRLALPESYPTGQFQVDMNPRGDLCVAPSLLPKTELARLANTWYAAIPTGSAFAAVAGYPATAGTRAELVIYNGYTDNTCLVVDQIWFMGLTSIGAIAGVTLLYQVLQIAAPTNDATVLISSPLGKAYGGSVQRQMAVTTMVTNKWAIAGTGSTNGASVTPGTAVVAEMGGNVIVKPGFTIGLNAIVGTAGGTNLMGMLWHEVKLPLI